MITKILLSFTFERMKRGVKFKKMAENLLKMSKIVPKMSDKVLQNNRNIKI